jgi:CRP-like cAMP-binding protein
MATSVAHLLLSAEALAALERISTPVDKPAGAALFRRGDEGAGLYLILHGTVRMAPDCDAPDHLWRTFGPGSVLGLPATVSGQPYSLTAMVEEDTQLAFVPRADVLELFRAKPLVCLHAMQTLGEEILAMRSGISDLTDQRKTGVRKS